MFNLNFSNDYKVVHINNELGNCVIGGAGTYMNEIYESRREDTGFIYMNLGLPTDDFYASDFMEQKDILIIGKEEAYKIEKIKCDILVIQFYELAFFINEDVRKNKKIVYVIHSVPTPEPPPLWDAFGGNEEIRMKFEYLCDVADVLVCVSNAEKLKLVGIYPQYREKIVVIYNGITNHISDKKNTNYRNSRNNFGFIGRADYRKGIFECVKAFSNIDAKLQIACPKNDDTYIEKILAYIEGADMWSRVKFLGWCIGKRKDNFFDSLDALVIPSLYEPFGYVVLEAMQNGVPVICSKNGGLGEILKGYKYLFDPYKDGDLEKTISSFMVDSNEEVEREQEILKKNLKKFSSQKMMSEYEKLWDSLL